MVRTRLEPASAVTHLSTNRARRRLTALIENNAPPVRRTATSVLSGYKNIVTVTEQMSEN